MIEKRKAKNITTWIITTRGWKLNFPNITPSPDPEPRNRRASGKTNCSGTKTGRLCLILRPAMVPKAQPGNRLAERNH